jgi:hypothetical protein
MRCNGQGGARHLILSLWTAAAACNLCLAEVPGGATIGAPTTSAPVDPFTAGGPVPTPFVPYASQGTDLDPALRGLGVAAPQSSPQPQPITISPTAPQPIGGGDLVPVTIPAAAKPESTTVVEPAKKPAAAKLESLTPIRPAVMSKSSPTTTAAKEKKPKKPATSGTPTPVATPKAAEPDTARPPVRFSFPQPIIPLESALRKWFGRSPSRG